ncbi:hypothetical protein [Actinoallomurus rhizosphaericola]|uniref:hypothetical protein n=1 Tax=Actinoallomurus rhizosphaericola TaxID=2952536 RepID=UPI00209234B0|nr:hypothetical protein [Actinoallomurus rhizosphaericola]MCO5999804.1 hypothetical protein [Actinoallomurus rhizosphaericola]
MADPQRVGDYVTLLSAALSRRGLEVRVTGDRVTATNEDVNLSQGVLLREVDGELMWCWLWVGPRPVIRGAPRPEPDVEPFSPADGIEYAALRIANVVAGRVEGAADV